MGTERGDREEERVRRRTAEALASAGVGHGRIAIELLYMIPESFRAQYVRLFLASIGDGMDSVDARGRRNERAAALGKASGKQIGPRIRNSGSGTSGVGGIKGTRGGEVMRPKSKGGGGSGGPGGHGGTSGGSLKDERATDLKRKVDRKLREIARFIDESMRDFEEGVKIPEEGEEKREGAGATQSINQRLNCDRDQMGRFMKKSS